MPWRWGCSKCWSRPISSSPRLEDNSQAEKRFAAVREHVEGKGGLGVMDKGLLERMKRHLEEGTKLDEE